MSNDENNKNDDKRLEGLPALGEDGGEAEQPKPIAYVRAVRREDLPEDTETPPGELFYAVHDEHGRPLALFADRELAMAVTRSHDFTALSVH